MKLFRYSKTSIVLQVCEPVLRAHTARGEVGGCAQVCDCGCARSVWTARSPDLAAAPGCCRAIAVHRATMPLFSDHISNMYYSGSSAYTSSPYSYSSAKPSYGTSFSASYLNPGGNYSTHSSLGGYSRAPLSSRWITSGGRAYSPMLTTISEKGTSSPVRINSPRRIPISGRTYVPSTYTPRPININTADIDVSRDKYRNKVHSSSSTTPTGLPPRRESPSTNKENGHDKPDTGVDTSPGPKRSTIKRDRTVVRLHTLKRKERDSPRKPVEVLNDATNAPATNDTEKQTESKKWREKLADDLAYTTQKEKKSLGAKLVEKFTLKEKNDDEYENHTKTPPKNNTEKEKSPLRQDNKDVISSINKSFDRRCSMELLAEQASLLDSLIRRENLSTAPLDVSKVGSENMLNTDMNVEMEQQDTKKRKLSQGNCLSTTKSDHSLHDRLFSRGVQDPSFPKRRSLRKCSSSGSIRKLDCIKEKPKKLIAPSLPPVVSKSKPKIKTRITSTVEVTPTTPQLKFIVENVTVEETTRPCKKDIIYSSSVEENPLNVIANELEDNEKNTKLQEEIEPLEVPVVLENIESDSMKDKKSAHENTQKTKGHRKSIKISKSKEKPKAAIDASGNLTSPEPEDGNFWDKIGKRETIYLKNRKQILDQVKEQNKRTLFWFPEKENINTSEEKIENLDAELFSRQMSADPIDEPIKNIEAKSSNETGKLQKENKKIIETPETEKSYTEVLDLSNTKDKTDYSLKKTISDANASTTLDLTDLTSSGKPSSKTFKKIESDKESQKEKKSLNKSKDIDDKMKPTKDIIKSENIPNECESAVEIIKSIYKPEGTETMNSSKTKNSLKRENVEKNQNISSLEADIMSGHSEKVSSSSNKKSSELGSTQSLDITKDSSETMTTKIPAKLSTTIHSQKDKIYKNKSIVNDTNGSNKTTNDAKRSPDLSPTKQYNQEDKIKNESIKNDSIDSSKIINAEKISFKTSSIKNSQKDNIKSKLLTNVTKNSSETINAEKLSAELSPTKQSQKDNIKSKSTKDITKDSNETINYGEIFAEHSLTNQHEKDNVKNKSIKNNKETLVNAETNALENLNIPESKIIGSATDKSIVEKNTNICEINKAKTDIKDVSTSSLRLLSEVIARSQNKETQQEDPITVKVENVSASIPNSQGNTTLVEEKLVKNNENKKESKIEIGDAKTNAVVTNKDGVTMFTNSRPVKEEKAIKPLIATPRPLQKKNPQTIRYSSSSSEEDSSEEETDEDGDDEAPKSGSSQGSTEYLECENNPDGRTSTGSNDSGFDSSAPTSPSGFLHAKKGKI